MASRPIKQGWNTVEQASLRLGVSKSTVYQWAREQRKNSPKLNFTPMGSVTAVPDGELKRFAKTWQITLIPLCEGVRLRELKRAAKAKAAS